MKGAQVANLKTSKGNRKFLKLWHRSCIYHSDKWPDKSILISA